MNRLLCIAVCCVISGCGSFVGRAVSDNVVGGPPYIGVRLDLRALTETRKDPGNSDVLSAPLAILDIPFSFCLDTILLPVDLIAWSMGKQTNAPFILK